MGLYDDILEYAGAGARGFWITTDEEARVRPDIEKLLNTRGGGFGLPSYYWSAGTGLIDARRGDVKLDYKKPLPTVFDWLDGMVLHNPEQPSAYVLAMYDPHPLITAKDNPISLRMLKEVMLLKQCFIIIVSTDSRIPEELSGLMTPLTQKLPTKQDLAAMVTSDIHPKWGIRLAEVAAGLTMHQARIHIARAVRRYKTVDEACAMVWQTKAEQFSTEGLVKIARPTETWDQVGGAYNLKKWIDARIQMFSPAARLAGAPVPRGILLVGPPGTGKSLISKAIAAKLGWQLLEWDASNVYGPYVGQTEAAVRRLIQTTEASAPCVLKIDEIAHQFSGFESSGQTDSGVVSRFIGKVLSWMEDRNDGIFIIGSTNEPWKLPHHMLRAGRFDSIWNLPAPEDDAMAEILAIHLKKIAPKFKQNDFDPEDLIKTMTERHFSGAEVEQVVIDAVQQSWPDVPTSKLLMHAAQVLVPNYVTMKEQYTQIDEWARTRAKAA